MNFFRNNVIDDAFDPKVYIPRELKRYEEYKKNAETKSLPKRQLRQGANIKENSIMSENIIHIRLKNQIILCKSELPDRLLDCIKDYHTHDNPKYLDAQKHDYYVGNIDPKITCYREDESFLYLPRGYMGNLISFLCKNGLECRIDDQRRTLPEVDFTFQGELREYQQVAVMKALQKDFGVLVAPCGSGKTVIALSLVAKRKQPTLIVIKTHDLCVQWKERISQYLGLQSNDIGIIGGGKQEIKSITVGIAQTLYRRDLKEISKQFGFLIVDECHCAPTNIFTEIISAFDCKYQLGLSATPYRRDRLNKLIYSSIGNTSATITDDDLQKAEVRIKPEIIARETSFYYDYREDSDYVPMISALVEDSDRNQLIIDDVVLESQDGNNYSLILSDRKAHCEVLASLLQDQDIDYAVLTGTISKKKREAIIDDFESGSLKVIFATGQLAGEGLDMPKLNRLFIVTPIRWRGRIKQYCGRILRPSEGKEDAKIYDYVDRRVGVLVNSHKTRCYQVYNHLN